MQISQNENRSNLIIDLIGLGSIGIISFLYSLFWSNFAELHVALPFLDFPIFVGEILLFWCVLLLIFKWSKIRFRLGRKYYLLLLYVAWVLFGALVGYMSWGPLALRNAALFYYPLFAVAGYHFYRKNFFNQKTIYALFVILIIMRLVRGSGFIYYFYPPYLMLSVILILKMKLKSLRWLGLLAVIGTFPYTTFFEGSRSFIIASFTVVFFLVLFYFFSLTKFNKTVKLVSTLSISFIFLFVFAKFTPLKKVRSLMNPEYIAEEFLEYDRMIEENKKTYLPQEIAVSVYNPNKKGEIQQNNLVEEERITKEVQDMVFSIAREINAKHGSTLSNGLDMHEADFKARSFFESLNISNDSVEIQQELAKLESIYKRAFEKERAKIKMEVFKKDEKEVSKINKERMIIFNREFGNAVLEVVANLIQRREIANERTIRTEYANIVFRLLIWRDMVQEIIKEKPWFGFGFGKPQRSISIENSGFADGEWGRDGWIAPHNVFLHMIYRAGILGFFIILGILVSLFLMTRGFVKKKSLVGLLLVSIFIYWLMLSSFLVVLELPYQAIPFWALFGMSYAYFFKPDTSEVAPV